MTGQDAAAAAVAELSRLYADALGSVGAHANAAVRAVFERKIRDRDFVYRPAELSQAVQTAVNEWAAKLNENEPAKTG